MQQCIRTLKHIMQRRMIALCSCQFWWSWVHAPLRTVRYKYISNLRPPEPRHSFSALIMTPCQVWSRWTYKLTFRSWYITLRYDHCDLDLWPWTFAAYRLWRDEARYQIWMQSSNPRRSYCVLAVDLMTLNAVLRIALVLG